MKKNRFVRVAVHAPLFESLTYLANDSENYERGDSVIVPLGKRKSSGVIVGFTDEAVGIEESKIKAILERDPERPKLSEKYLSWCEWVSKYYVYPLGQVLELAFPPLKKAGRKKNTNILPEFHEPQTRPEQLTQEQIDVINSVLSTPGYATHLVFGVTGSGKTEVYLQLLEKTLAAGKRGLVLVPEISLTPQLISRFTSRFGDSIAVLHSHLTDRDRTNQWWEMVAGEKQILIGARSALFCPFENLGLIVVDEEHEPSYKQEEKLKYHARDAAIMLAHTHQCPIILGSATPSLESWQNALSKKYKLHKMSFRATQVEMPDIEIIDLKNKKDSQEQSELWTTPLLLHEIAERLEKNEQSVLFLNRRGLAQSVICPACGNRKECPNCSIALTLHAKTHLVCHYCDYHESLPEICDICRECELKPIGLGTELVEQEVKKLFPGCRTVRADRDEIQSRAELEEFISKIEKREADVLVGTQMIAKGLDFPHLTFVGVLLADIALNLPDFRAAERSYQLLSQVSGRAGRHKTRGKVLIQTFNPEHPSIVHAQKHDFESFAAQELSNRSELGYPPFGRLMQIRLQGLDKKETERAAEKTAALLRTWIPRSKSSEGIDVLGPSESPLFRLRNKYRYQILVKSPKNTSLSSLGWSLLQHETLLPSGVRMLVDIDPLNML